MNLTIAKDKKYVTTGEMEAGGSVYNYSGSIKIPKGTIFNGSDPYIKRGCSDGRPFKEEKHTVLINLDYSPMFFNCRSIDVSVASLDLTKIKLITEEEV